MVVENGAEMNIWT